jgi:hypothetical protein
MYEATWTGRLDVAETFANEALQCARVAGDDWWLGMAANASALAARDTAELRERVDRAASLLAKAGNAYHRAELLAGVIYMALAQGNDRDATEFVRRAIPLAERLDVPFLWLLVRGNSALAALLTGDIDTARHGFREELRLSRALVDLFCAHEGLLGLAAVAAVVDDAHRAALLFGAAAAHPYGQPNDLVHARVNETFLYPARSRHGADAWDAAVRAGETLSLEDAIAYALEETSG